MTSSAACVRSIPASTSCTPPAPTAFSCAYSAGLKPEPELRARMARPSKGLRLAVSATRRASHRSVARAAGAAAKCTAPGPLMTAPRVPNAAPAAAASSTLPTMKFGSLTSRSFGRAALHRLVAVMPGHSSTTQRHDRHARALHRVGQRPGERPRTGLRGCMRRQRGHWLESRDPGPFRTRPKRRSTLAGTKLANLPVRPDTFRSISSWCRCAGIATRAPCASAPAMSTSASITTRLRPRAAASV